MKVEGGDRWWTRLLLSGEEKEEPPGSRGGHARFREKQQGDGGRASEEARYEVAGEADAELWVGGEYLLAVECQPILTFFQERGR